MVWHRLRLTGKVAEPVLALAVIEPDVPTLTVATVKAPAPFAPGMPRMQGSPLAAKATISGTGVAEADSRSGLKPWIARRRVGRGAIKPKDDVGRYEPGVRAKGDTKLCEAPAAIPIGVFGLPVSALVAGFVV